MQRCEGESKPSRLENRAQRRRTRVRVGDYIPQPDARRRPAVVWGEVSRTIAGLATARFRR
ncbi:MAG: hypothetical protein MOB07_10530 [Acidobacteria bacterium]|nr:hypothetical protein [Acidobacteriota bacterium]